MHGILASLSRGSPPVTFDFTAGSLPSGLAFTRSGSGYTVRIGTNSWTVGGAIASSDVPRFGRSLDADPLGLVLEEARTQHLLASDISLAPWATHSGTVTSDGAAPMGGTKYTTSISAAQLGRLYYGVPALTNLQRYAVSIHAQGVVGGESSQLVLANAGLNAGRAVGTTLTTDWTRPQTSLIAGTDTGTGLVNCFVCSNYGPAGNGVTNILGGVAAGARGGRVAGAQVEAGGFATELIPSTVAQVTRNGEHLEAQSGAAWAGAFAYNGTVSFSVSLQAKGGSSGYAQDFYLWYRDAANWARFNGDTAQLALCVAGVTYTAGGLPTWSVEDTLEFVVVSGNAGVRATMRVNGGAAYLMTLGAPVRLGAVPPITAALNLLCNGTANQFTSRVRTISNQLPAWSLFSTSPDWRRSLDGWNDTARSPIRTSTDNYITPNGWASVDVTTDAANATFAFFCDDTAPGFEAAIEVQDVASNTWVRVLATTNNAVNSIAAVLPGAGMRQLRIYPGTLRAALGSWPMRVVSHDGTVCLTRATAAATPTRLIILGDSIPEQIGTGIVARDNAIGQLRSLTSSTRVTYVGAGGDGLAGHYQLFPELMREVKAAASDVAAGGQAIIYIQWGYNDYNGAWPSSAAYATQLTNLFTQLRTACPSAKIVLQTLGTTTNTTAGNGLGDAGWRTMQSTQFAAWGDGNSQLVSGTSVYALADLLDGVHLTTAGSAVYGAAIKAALTLV